MDIRNPATVIASTERTLAAEESVPREA